MGDKVRVEKFGKRLEDFDTKLEKGGDGVYHAVLPDGKSVPVMVTGNKVYEDDAYSVCQKIAPYMTGKNASDIYSHITKPSQMERTVAGVFVVLVAGAMFFVLSRSGVMTGFAVADVLGEAAELKLFVGLMVAITGLLAFRMFKK